MYSHFKAISTAYQDGSELAMIVEDDLSFTSSLSVIHQFLDLLPKDWDCFQVHYIDNLLINYLIRENVENRIIKGYLMSAACYILNRKGMKKFLDLMGKQDEKGAYQLNVPFLDNAETEEFVYRYINTYFSLYPILNTNENMGSDIYSHKINFNNMILTEDFFKLRRDYQIKNLNIIELQYDRHYFSSQKEILEELAVFTVQN